MQNEPVSTIEVTLGEMVQGCNSATGKSEELWAICLLEEDFNWLLKQGFACGIMKCITCQGMLPAEQISLYNSISMELIFLPKSFPFHIHFLKQV
jgi:hypothetical protein